MKIEQQNNRHDAPSPRYSERQWLEIFPEAKDRIKEIIDELKQKRNKLIDTIKKELSLINRK